MSEIGVRRTRSRVSGRGLVVVALVAALLVAGVAREFSKQLESFQTRTDLSRTFLLRDLVASEPLAAGVELKQDIPVVRLNVEMANQLSRLRRLDPQVLCVSALFGTYGRQNNADVLMTVLLDGDSASSHVFRGSSLVDNKYAEACLADIPVARVASADTLRIVLSSVSGGQSNSVSVWTTGDLTYGQLEDPLFGEERAMMVKLRTGSPSTSVFAVLTYLFLGLTWLSMSIAVVVGILARPSQSADVER